MSQWISGILVPLNFRAYLNSTQTEAGIPNSLHLINSSKKYLSNLIFLYLPCSLSSEVK